MTNIQRTAFFTSQLKRRWTRRGFFAKFWVPSTCCRNTKTARKTSVRKSLTWSQKSPFYSPENFWLYLQFSHCGKNTHSWGKKSKFVMKFKSILKGLDKEIRMTCWANDWWQHLNHTETSRWKTTAFSSTYGAHSRSHTGCGCSPSFLAAECNIKQEFITVKTRTLNEAHRS